MRCPASGPGCPSLGSDANVSGGGVWNFLFLPPSSFPSPTASPGPLKVMQGDWATLRGGSCGPLPGTRLSRGDGAFGPSRRKEVPTQTAGKRQAGFQKDTYPSRAPGQRAWPVTGTLVSGVGQAAT